MSPIKRALWLALPLVAGACGGDGDAAESTPSTIPVGGVLDAFPAVESAPPTTVAAAPTTSSSTVAPTTSAEPVAISWVDELAGRVGDGAPAPAPPATDLLRDDTGQVRLQVPLEWAERSTIGNGEAPYVAASPDLLEFLDGYDAPGLTVVVLPTPDRPGDALASYAFDGACTDDGRRRYADADVGGLYHVWKDCGGTATDIVTMTVTPPDGDETAVLLAQLVTPADLAALDEAFHSLRF